MLKFKMKFVCYYHILKSQATMVISSLDSKHLPRYATILLVLFIRNFRVVIYLDISGMVVNITKEKNGAKMTFRPIQKFWFIFYHAGSTLICLQILQRDPMPVHSLSDMSSKRLMVSSRTFECSLTFFKGTKNWLWKNFLREFHLR